MKELVLRDDKGNKIDLPRKWSGIDSETQDALLRWYNVAEDTIEMDDLILLAELYHANKFEHGMCAICGNYYQIGNPDNWDDFKGVFEIPHMGEVCTDCYNEAAYVIRRSGVGCVYMDKFGQEIYEDK